MSCRDEILKCANSIIMRKRFNEFTLEEILDCMNQKGTTYKESTIRTHVTSRMCANAPDNHAVTFNDFERIGRGIYKQLNPEVEN